MLTKTIAIKRCQEKPTKRKSDYVNLLTIQMTIAYTCDINTCEIRILLTQGNRKRFYET